MNVCVLFCPYNPSRLLTLIDVVYLYVRSPISLVLLATILDPGSHFQNTESASVLTQSMRSRSWDYKDSGILFIWSRDSWSQLLIKPLSRFLTWRSEAIIDMAGMFKFITSLIRLRPEVRQSFFWQISTGPQKVLLQIMGESKRVEKSITKTRIRFRIWWGVFHEGSPCREGSSWRYRFDVGWVQ